jgi:hypothetical protein
MKRLEVDWDRFERDLQHADPPTADDVSRTLDGTPLDSEAAIVRHMAELERDGVLTESGTMFTDLLDVLDRDGEAAMIRRMHQLYGPPAR